MRPDLVRQIARMESLRVKFMENIKPDLELLSDVLPPEEEVTLLYPASYRTDLQRPQSASGFVLVTSRQRLLFWSPEGSTVTLRFSEIVNMQVSAERKLSHLTVTGRGSEHHFRFYSSRNDKERAGEFASAISRFKLLE